MAFQIPLHFEDLTRTAAGSWQVTPSTQRQASSEHLLDLLSENVDIVLSSASSPSQHFCALYTVISRYQNLFEAQRCTLVDILVSLLRTTNSTEIGQLKIALFQASGLVVAASNVSPACKFWEKSGREKLLEAVYNLTSAISHPSSFQPSDLDQLSSQLVRSTLHVLEHPASSKDKHIRPLIAHCLASALQLDERQTLPIITGLIYALCRYEHLSVPLSGILFCLLSEYPHFESFVSEFIREITRLPGDRLVQDTVAAKSISAFFSDFVESHVPLFIENIALVLSLLDIDAYVLRNGIVHVITTLIQHEPKADDPLLDVLLQRALRDAHAFTRSKALQSWITLAESSIIPTRMFPILAEMATSRLEDRTAAVRKYSVQLLSTLLKSNPFGPVLKLSHFSIKLEEILQQVPKEKSAPDTQSENSETTKVDLDSGDEDNASQEKGHSDVDQDSVSEENEVASIVGDTPEETEDEGAHVIREDLESEIDTTTVSEEEQQMQKKKKYYSTAVGFIKAVEKGLGTIFVMLRSKSITDIAEAVSFLVTAVQFQLEAASGSAVRKMLPLLLARENNVTEKAIDAYVRLLAPGGVETLLEKEAAMCVAKGLTALVDGATIGELTCLEKLVIALNSSRKESHIVTSTVVGVLWDMFANRIPGATFEQRRAAGVIVAMVAAKDPDSLLQRLDVILEIGLGDPNFRRWSCVALCNLSPEKDPGGKIVLRLCELCRSSDDLASIEQAINGIFVLSREPEPIVSAIIRDLAAELQACPEKVVVQDLARFFLVIGQVAVKQLVRIEQMVSKLRKHFVGTFHSEDNTEEEEQAGLEADYAQEDAEKELVSPNSLLGRYGIMSRKVASDEHAPAELRASAVLCLAKLMCVQSKFCENNLRLLFSILGSSKDPIVRVNAVTALGDLTFRFPNLVEPWSPHIYKSLRDEDNNVRKSTLLVLTHLILNDMIKVKGQIVGIAVCITDKERRIADLARLFFYELSRKSANAIYNILPDTISCMSKMENLTSEYFKTVVEFLVGLMDKEKHADGMVEKLCHRFRTSESERENRDLSYCISQLNISAKGLQKLNENFKSYSTAILDDLVYKYMSQAFAKGNKPTAPGNINHTWEELTAKVEAVRSSNATGGDDNEWTSVTTETRRVSESDDTIDVTTKRRTSTRQRLSRGGQQRTGSSRGRVHNSTVGRRKPPRPPRASRPQRSSQTSTVSQPARMSRTPRSTRKRIQIIESESESSEDDIISDNGDNNDDDDDDDEEDENDAQID